MPSNKLIDPKDLQVSKAFLNQLIDVLQQDICDNRKKYQLWTTGGIGPGVTSSYYQTVYDSDFTLGPSNPIFDITVGIPSPAVKDDGIASVLTLGADSGGKYLYPSSSLMMREKHENYEQYAAEVLGNNTSLFTLPVDASPNSSNITETEIDSALFLHFKRTFCRDAIKESTFSMGMYTTASWTSTGSSPYSYDPGLGGRQNLYSASVNGLSFWTDKDAPLQKFFSQNGGPWSYLIDAANTTRAVGRIYYQHGLVVLDIEKITSSSQFHSGTIDGMTPTGQLTLGGPGTQTAGKSKLIPDLMCSGSIDNIIDHFCESRFGCSATTAIAFQNVTNINSLLVYCYVMPQDFNVSANPTYIEPFGTTNAGRITIYDPSLPEEVQDTFTYITTLGLYDASGGLLAVAKLSRPIEKNASRALTFRVRLDF